MAKKLLDWNLDAATLFWANHCPLPLPKSPVGQFAGRLVDPSTWTCRLRKPSFPELIADKGTGMAVCSPDNITWCWQNDRVLEALVLTICWGSMARTVDHVYTAGLKRVEQVLLAALTSIDQTNSVATAWAGLAEKLSWTSTMTSKVLHFAARSRGFYLNPPVPINNEVIVMKVWPRFKSAVVSMQGENLDLPDVPCPRPWSVPTSAWDGYRRYMTAVSCWAGIQGWTTTEVENTLYKV